MRQCRFLIDKEEVSEHAGANVEVVSGIADPKRNYKSSGEARLQDKPYGYYTNVKAVPSIAKKNDASSEVGANKDVIVSSSTSSEAADKESDSAVEMEVNAVVAESTNANKLQSDSSRRLSLKMSERKSGRRQIHSLFERSIK
jgi:hypothetical protein